MFKRMLAILTALVMLVTIAGVSLAETAETAKTTEPILQEIEALNGGTVTVHRNKGRVTFIGGSCSSESVKSYEDAERVIRSVLPLLGGNGQTAFERWRILNDPAGNTYYVFQQVLKDALVPGGAVKVITDVNGTMTGLTGSIVPVAVQDGKDAKDSKAITAEEAEALVLTHEKETGSAEPDVVKGKTVKIVLPVDRVLDIEADEIDSRYVWAVYTTNPSASVSGTDLPYLAHYVTQGGEYLYNLPTILPGDAAGSAGYDASYVFEFMEPVDYTGYVDYSDGTEHEISVTLMRDTRTGMYYLGNIEHRIVVADCWEFLYNGGHVVLEYSPDNLEWDQTSLMSLYQYCRAYDYYKAIGWIGADGEETPIIVLKDFCDKDHNPVDNAAYAGKFYGWQTFLSSSVNDFAQCLDVATHEFTHCVTGTVMTYNAYKNDYGAINEAISDIHGNLCEMLAGATEDTSWLLGESSRNTVRSMSDPHQFQQPEYVWDVYYRAEVKDPTDANDHGGVHGNSSLLNRVAYLLCAEGGMSLEEARIYWFAVDCAMVPGSDYAQLRDLLPWVLKITGLEKYEDALEKAMNETRLGMTGEPASVEADKALLTLNLPDNEVFNNGKWILQFASVNTEKIFAFLSSLMADLSSGNLDNYPKAIRDLAPSAPTPTPEPAAEGDKPGFLGTLLNAFMESMTKKDEPESTPEPEKEDPEKTELLEWLRGKAKEFFYSDMGNAGADGHFIRIMSKPGLTFPLLTYLSADSGGAMIEQMKIVVFVNGHWFDLSKILDNATEPEGEPGIRKTGAELLQSDLVAELMNALKNCKSPLDFVKALALDVKGGETVEIPTEGLEKIDLSGGIRDKAISGSKEPNDRKSRPKLP